MHIHDINRSEYMNVKLNYIEDINQSEYVSAELSSCIKRILIN